ncbi:hypothetical protein Pcinc_020065 [Petrolisthes cinctipes]|uniref:Uncharacterized protein n=1 Tax=Petrolisthes cinctipes TaxID=88211 RepID=A0AAE1KGX2_PETCI|nr:hypothetical protein Pcinc_020065 [Petrolisthes cinctipes]
MLLHRPAPIMQPDRVLKLGLIMTPPTPPTPPEAKFIKLQGHDQRVFGVGSYRSPLLFPEGEDNEGRECVQTRRVDEENNTILMKIKHALTVTDEPSSGRL